MSNSKPRYVSNQGRCSFLAWVCLTYLVGLASFRGDSSPQFLQYSASTQCSGSPIVSLHRHQGLETLLTTSSPDSGFNDDLKKATNDQLLVYRHDETDLPNRCEPLQDKYRLNNLCSVQADDILWPPSLVLPWASPWISKLLAYLFMAIFVTASKWLSNTSQHASSTKEGSHPGRRPAHNVLGIKERCNNAASGVNSVSISSNVLLTLMILLASPSRLCAGTRTPEAAVTLPEGANGNVQFLFHWPQEPSSNPIPRFALRFQTKNVPFYIYGTFNEEGLMHQSQINRFSVTYTKSNNSMLIDLSIRDCRIEDIGIYTLGYIVDNHRGSLSGHLSKHVNVIPVDDTTNCSIKPSSYHHTFHEVTCHVNIGHFGRDQFSILCFQNDQKLPYKGELSHSGPHVVGVFWLMSMNGLVSCCSHIVGKSVNQSSCKDFEYSPNDNVQTTSELKYVSRSGPIDTDEFATSSFVPTSIENTLLYVMITFNVLNNVI